MEENSNNYSQTVIFRETPCIFFSILKHKTPSEIIFCYLQEMEFSNF